MGNSQMILIVGAIVLLSVLSINANRSILTSTETTVNSEAILAATAMANELMNEICTKAYDEASVTSLITETNIPNSFTSSQYLGPDGENYPAFDDIDDFNGYSRVTPSPRTGNFSSQVTVDYVNINNPDVAVAMKTRLKRIEVAVTNTTLLDTLRLYYYSCY